jgi:SAM-dependent methyltransferase
VPDAIFEHPRLAPIYDALDPDRSDLDAYTAMAGEFGARQILDLGCGTGVLALLLSRRGFEVTGVDPAAGSLDVARAKAGASKVRWVDGDATAIPAMRADLALMTGNAAQAVVDERQWVETLDGVRNALRPGGRFVFETRDPESRAWEGWTEARTRTMSEVPGVGAVERWVELTEVSLPLVSFRWTYVFASDGQVLTSDSTLRFPSRSEVQESLAASGYALDEVRDAPDRPGREFVFVARRAH